jgi:DNA-directed RNA polymerase specialized sigma24 family protein
MEMLLLKHVDDCSYLEIAQRLGVTAGVVQMRLFRARQTLREMMLQQYPED